MQYNTGNIPRSDKPVELTTEYFNNFFKPNFVVSQNIDNSVTAALEYITGNESAAKVLASSILYTALTQNVDPMAVITELSNLFKKNASTAPASTLFNTQVDNTTDQYARPGPPVRQNNFTEINAYLAVFLNLNRVNTSLLGIVNEPQVGKYVKRAILP